MSPNAMRSIACILIYLAGMIAMYGYGRPAYWWTPLAGMPICWLAQWMLDKAEHKKWLASQPAHGGK